jgi:hypothetical protein
MVHQYGVFDARQIALDGPPKSLIEHWDKVRGIKFAPKFGTEFRLEDLLVDIVPCCSVVDVLDDGADYLYRFWGTRNVSVKNIEMTGKRNSAHGFAEFVEQGQTHFSLMLDLRRPTIFIYEGAYETAARHRLIAVRFPLSSDGETIDKIFTWQNLNEAFKAWVESFKTANSTDTKNR